MSTHKHIDRICCAAVALALLLTVALMNGSALGIQAADHTMGYEDRLFDTSAVHTIDIVMVRTGCSTPPPSTPSTS